LLLIGPEPPPLTGMEIATRSLVRELRRASIPFVRVDTADPNDELGNRARWTLRNIQLALRHLASVTFHSLRPNVAAVYLPIAQEFPALLRDVLFVAVAKTARKPVVLHLHGGNLATYYQSRSRLTKWVMKRTLGRAVLGIVLSDPLRPELECLLPAERIVSVANGIDVPHTGKNGRARARDVQVLFLSSLFLWKGILLFVEAFAAARAERPSLRAVVGGAWPSKREQEQTLALVHRLGVTDAIEFVGAVEETEKSKLFSDAAIFCFPSLVPEGQGLVVLEAMAASLPVVATDWPGVADTVVAGETGLLVPPEPRAIAERLIYLADNADERERMGRAGRQRYEQQYTQAAFGDRMLRVLSPVLQRRDLAATPHFESNA
jgi:glycosyltransferase involved in cell wall biosynthesis